MKMKVIIIKMVVITVADKSKEPSLYSLLEPFMYFSIQKAQPFTYLLPTFKYVFGHEPVF